GYRIQVATYDEKKSQGGGAGRLAGVLTSTSKFSQFLIQILSSLLLLQIRTKFFALISDLDHFQFLKFTTKSKDGILE
ncbi:hypothetical protein Csa_023787, partial [Cucumis sativus]